MLAHALTIGIAARAATGLGDTVQRQDRVAFGGEPQRTLTRCRRYQPLRWLSFLLD